MFVDYRIKINVYNDMQCAFGWTCNKMGENVFNVKAMLRSVQSKLTEFSLIFQ